MTPDRICTCGHPESKHDDRGLFGRGHCTHKWWVDNTADCRCQRFEAEQQSEVKTA